MTTTTLSHQTNSTISLLSQWFAQGSKLFLKSPLKLFASLIAIIIVTGLLQILPAPIGIFVSKWIGAILGAALWPLLNALDKEDHFSFKGLANYTGWQYLPLLAFVLIVPFVFQIGVATIMLGEQGLALILYGQIGDATAFEVGLLFASAAPLSILLMFVPACLLLGGESVTKSVTKGVSMVLKTWQAMLALTVLNALVLFLAPFTLVLSVVLMGPLLICVNYSAYQSLRHS